MSELHSQPSRSQHQVSGKQNPAIVWDVIVVGAGPAGARFIKKYRALNPSATILWFNAESYSPYNRVKLSELLAGNLSGDFLQSEYQDALQEDENLFLQFGCEIGYIIPRTHQIIDQQHRIYQYKHLVLATGSRPYVPNIAGKDAKGVYTFRDYADAEALKARLCHSRHTVVIGGGLLGIEAACAMQQDATQVTLVHQSQHLMNKQLDDTAGALLTKHIEQKGIQVFTGSGLSKIIEKQGRVVGVELMNGLDIPCDTVVLTTGIKPNKEIALEAGLKVGQGIRTNIYMQTSDTDIYAIGECAEFNGEIHGLVAPGLEQASVAAFHMAGEDARYLGAINSAQLKVANQPVLSVGTLTKEGHPLREEETYNYTDASGKPHYVKIILHAGHLIGAICYGTDKQFNRLQQAVTQHERIWPWQLWRFRKTGVLWPDTEADDVVAWPETTRVCQCTGVTKGDLTRAMVEQQATSVEQLSQCTGAGTVCGSCKPLLADLVQDHASRSGVEQVEPNTMVATGKKTLLISGLLALIVLSLWLLFPAFPVRDSWSGFHISDVWSDSLYKQISGFTLLGLTLLGLLLSLRKRTQWIEKLSFISLRHLHTLLGVGILLLVLLHTGLNAGSNLNFALLTTFLLASAMGAVTAVGIAASSDRGKQTLRKWLSQLHIYITWPLPFLLAFHILSVYWF